MLKKRKVGKGRWVAGTEHRFSGLGSVDPVNIRTVSVPALKTNPFKKRALKKRPVKK